jgi:hypothetical protein
MYLNLDILNMIFEFSDLYTKTRIISTCSELAYASISLNKFFITDLANADHKYRIKTLPIESLKLPYFKHLLKLNVYNLHHFISQNDILNLNLVEFYCDNNYKINDVYS